MWQEARRQEKKIREAMIDYQRRAERRREHYAKLVSEIKLWQCQVVLYSAHPTCCTVCTVLYRSIDSRSNIRVSEWPMREEYDTGDVIALVSHNLHRSHPKFECMYDCRATCKHSTPLPRHTHTHTLSPHSSATYTCTHSVVTVISCFVSMVASASCTLTPKQHLVWIQWCQWV